MRFAHLVDTARRVARRGRRSAKIEALAELLGALAEDDLPVGVAFLAGELPTGRIGIGHRAVSAALAAADDRAAGAAPLRLGGVLESLRAIAAEQGPGSRARRHHELVVLFEAASDEERDFLARLLLGELRQGALAGLATEALAHAMAVPAAAVRRAVMLSGDLGAVALAARREGVGGLARFRLELFRPIQPMLASPVDELAAMPDRIAGPGTAGDWSRVAIELKIDGARVQVHRRGRTVRVFSRQLNEVTASVPEVVEVALGLPAEELVLDGETFGVRPGGAPLPFQETMRRFGRRIDVDAMRRELPLDVRFFDCLLVDGAELIDRPLAERWRTLERLVPQERRIERLLPSGIDDAERFFERALELGHEGLMAKDLASSYEAGNRGFSWLKAKPAHTLDLVVLAAEWGSGRRRGWLSNLHLGARDPRGEAGDAGGFVMLGKTFKGLTDELLAWQTARLRGLAVGDPDAAWVVPVRPELVVEIAFGNVQASSQYPAGMALRFARVKRYRGDKPAAEASTLDEVRAHFARAGATAQAPRRRAAGAGDADDPSGDDGTGTRSRRPAE